LSVRETAASTDELVGWGLSKKECPMVSGTTMRRTINIANILIVFLCFESKFIN
jgi:hypothetical protein